MKKSEWILAGIIAALVLFLAVGITHWLHTRGGATGPGWQQPPEMSETKTIKRVQDTMKAPLKSIDRKPVEEKIKNLPPEVIANPDARYTATAEIPPNKGKTDVICVTDIKTGETQIISKPKAEALLGLPQEFFAGMRYGISTEGTKYTVYGGYSAVRIWKITLSPYVSVSYLPSAKDYGAKTTQGEAGAQAEIRW